MPILKIAANSASTEVTTPHLSVAPPGIEAVQAPATMVFLFRTIVEQAPPGKLAFFKTAISFTANHSFQQWLGYFLRGTVPSQNDRLDGSFSLLVDPAMSLETHFLNRAKVATVKRSYCAKMASLIDVEFNSAVIDYRNRPAILAFVQDITQRKQVEFETSPVRKKTVSDVV